jgi:DNA-directed RNA polymerase subunit RPC12/RpoP
MKDKNSGLFGFLVSGGGIIPYSEETKRYLATGYKCPNCGHRMVAGLGMNVYSADGKKLQLSSLFPDSVECQKCNYRWKYFRDSQTVAIESSSVPNVQSQQIIETHKSQPLNSIRTDQPNINIHLEKESERIRTSSETVLVPAGVKITVKRSRTVEHTVDVSWGELKGGSLNLGLKDFFGISIKSEIEKKRGRSYKESETIEYEVELNGDKVSQYNLVWADIWCKGFIEITINNTTQMLPFRFRDSSELEVIPAKNNDL